jgi:hypothetical protein
MEEPDFSVEVDSLEEEPNESMPQIIPRNVPLIAKPVAKPTVMPVAKPISNSVEPPYRSEQVSTLFTETVEIENPAIDFPDISPYPETSPKQHHFRLNRKTDRDQLIHMWSQIGITAELNESGRNKVDVTLMRQDQLVGMIQFLHFDRRDRSHDDKHYVKIYFYQFNDASMFEKAKQIMRDFFHQIGSRPRPPRRRFPRLTMRSPRITRRKRSTSQRSHRKKVHRTKKHRKPSQK